MSVIDLSDRRVGYELHGSGPVVVLVHSLGGNRSLYAAQLRDLASEYTVVAYDLRGHGETDLGAREPSLDVLADDLGELLDALDLGPAHLVGQSIGAMTLLAFAGRHPARAATYVVLDGASHSDADWDERYTERAARVERHGVRPLASELAERSLGPVARDRLVDRYAELLARAPQSGYAWACRSMVDFDLRPRLGAIAAPTLVGAGADDTLTTPEHAREISAAIVGAEAVEISGSGHVPCLEQPDAVTALIRDWAARHPLVGT